METSIKLKASTIAFLLRLLIVQITVNEDAIMDILQNITPDDYDKIYNEFGVIELKETEYPFCVNKTNLTDCLRQELTLSQFNSIQHLTKQ